jgi:hypothetical protein
MDMEIDDEVWFAVISALVRPHPDHESTVGPSVTELYPKTPDLVKGSGGGYVFEPDTLPKGQRRSGLTEGIKHLGQLARTSKTWLKLVLRWSETLPANSLPAVQNAFSRPHDERLSYYAESVSGQTKEGERRQVFHDALFGGTAKDRSRSRLERCMLVAMLTVLPDPTDLYMHPCHGWMWECDAHPGADAHTLASCKDPAAPIFTAPYGLKQACSENGAWSRCGPDYDYPGTSKYLDFQALQIDYYYGPYDPRLRLDKWDRQEAIDYATELDGNEYEGDSYAERIYINQKLGLSAKCFRSQHADPLHGIDMNVPHPWADEPYHDDQDEPRGLPLNHFPYDDDDYMTGHTRPQANRPGGRAGDWKCALCGVISFTWRSECFGCGASKRDAGPSASRGAASGGAASGGTARRSGDWECPDCGVNCFASRTECFRCGAERPAPRATERTARDRALEFDLMMADAPYQRYDDY